MRLIDVTIGICVSALFTIACGAMILPDGFWAEFWAEFRKLVAGEPTIDRPARGQFKRMAVVCADWFGWGGKKRADFVDDNKIGEGRTDANEPAGT